MENTLTGQETNLLIKQYQELGRPQSMRNLIANNNIPLMKHILSTYNLYTFGNKDVEEIEQEAFILMLEAIDKYDYDKGSFSTLLYMYLKKIFRKTEDYNKEVSLNQPINNSEDEDISLLDLVEDETVKENFEEIEQKSENENIRNRISEILKEDEKEIIFSYYGINSISSNTPTLDGINSISSNTPTLEEMSKKYNMSIHKIRYRIDRAKAKLRRDTRLKYIYYDYIDPIYLKSTSIIEFGSKTNLHYSSVENLTIKRLEQEEEIKSIITDTVDYLDVYF